MPELENQGQEQGQPASQTNSSTTAPSQNPTGNSEGNANQNPPEGEKLFAGKYKSVEELEKGYKESTKYGRDQASALKDLQNKMPKAPEKYAFDFSKTEDLKDVTLGTDSPDFKPLLDVFKKHNLSQETVDEIVQTHLRTQASLVPTKEQVKEGLGGNADVILSRLQAHTDKLPLEDQQIISSLSDDPKVIDFMYRHLVGEELPVPANAGGGGEAPKSAADLKAEAFKYKADNARSIGWDKSQQDKYTQMMHAALAAEEREKKLKK